jgi:chaperonin cofactor prefoldin
MLSYFAYNQFKRLTERNEKLELKVDTLQREMMELIVEEKEKLSMLVAENTKALNELRATIIKYLLESAE